MRTLALLSATCMTALCLHGISYVGYGSFSKYYKRLETGLENFQEASESVRTFAQVDAFNLASAGEREALEWTRKYLELYPPEAVEAAIRDDNTGLRTLSGSARIHAL